MLRPKLIAVVVLALLVLVLFIQNTEVIAIRLFFWEFEASRVILIGLAALTGFFCGYLVARVRSAPRSAPEID